MKFPHDPLIPFIEAAACRQDREPTPAFVAELAGTYQRKVFRWIKGGLTAEEADVIACALGYEPEEIWPEYALVGTVECADTKCSERFMPRNGRHRFCSRRCCQRWHSRMTRRRELRTAAGRETNRQKARAYYAENTAYCRARELRRSRERAPVILAARREERRRQQGGQLWLDGGRLLGFVAETHPLAVMRKDIAELIGCAPWAINKWRRGSPVRRHNAERFAANLGVDPSTIWPEWFDVTHQEQAAA